MRAVAAGVAGAVGLLVAPIVGAQVVRDGSLGTGLLDVGPGVDPNGGGFANYLILPDLGEQRGVNLFHSFSEFSIPSSQVAMFTGPDAVGGMQSVENVFSRVTGNAPSNLFGTLRSAIPGADIFLFNSNGIAMGPGAVLDLSGSFYASTADEVHFENQVAPWPTGLATNALLTHTAPTAFGFTSANPAPITVDGLDRATLPAGETFSLVGGDVRMTGASNIRRTLSIESGTVQLASVQGPVVVPIDVSTFDTDTVPASDLGTVVLEDGIFIDVGNDGLGPGMPGGRVVIRGGQLVITGTSQLLSTTSGDTDGAAKAVDVQVAGLVEISQGSRILSTALSGNGRAGDLHFDAGEMQVRDARTALIARSNQPILPSTGDGGDIQIQVDGTLTVEDGAEVITASGFELARLPGAQGGDLVIDAGSVVVNDAIIGARTSGSDGANGTGRSGNAGNVLITATDDVTVSGRNASIAAPGDVGDGGSIEINTDKLRVAGGALVSVSAFRTGAAGNIVIHATDVSLDGTNDQTGTPSGIVSQSISGASGAAGSIELHVADTLSITNGAQVSVSSQSVSSGPTGNIDIAVDRLVMQNSLDGIRAESASPLHDAGEIRISAGNEIKIDDSSITTQADRASGGNINVHAEKLIQIRRQSGDPSTPLITAEVAPNQLTQGGNVSLNARTVVIDKAGIRASSPDGLGGNIQVTTDAFVVSGGDVQEVAPGFFSSGGEVFGGSGSGQLASTGAYFDVSGSLSTGSFEVRGPGAAIVAGLESLSQNFLDVSQLASNQCAARQGPVGSLVVAGQDRVPAAPGERIRSLYLLEL